MSESFWVLIGFIIFTGLIIKFLRPTLSKALDDKIAIVQQEIITCEQNLRNSISKLEEANENLLLAKEESREMLAKVDSEVEELRTKKMHELNIQLGKREQESKIVIENLYSTAEKHLQSQIMDNAQSLAIEYLKQENNNQANPDISTLIKTLKY